MSLNSLEVQRRAATCYWRISRLLALDYLWTESLDSPIGPTARDVPVLMRTAREMDELMSTLNHDLAWIESLARAEPLLMNKLFETFLDGAELSDESKIGVRKQIRSIGTFAEYLELCAEGAIRGIPDERDELGRKVVALSGGQYPPGDLKKQTKCFLVGVGIGGALLAGALTAGAGALAGAAALVAATSGGASAAAGSDCF